ncbi:hypothetical protein D770_16725 [Flammeovirgaceae bacterium 311]|nr:hypothetical protein D770_16725 [Flammeovirgaceae bacterium 311]
MNEAMKNTTVVITIPIYKEVPDKYEILSFKQCLNVLGSYQIRIVAPEGLDLCRYFDLCQSTGTPAVDYFDKSYFKGISGYNRLMLSIEFTKKYINFEYILIYQLDAYVFKDELSYWCSKGYDFIGAPGFIDSKEEDRYQFSEGMNGGFSLRKVSAMMELLHTWQKYFNLYDILTTKHLSVKSKVQLTYDYLIQGLPSGFRKTPMAIFYKHHEDFVLTMIFSKERKVLSVPPPLEASKFSFELHPGLLYELNENELPFGCHAWNKYNIGFWSGFIPEMAASTTTCSS